jgi:hypothetical protein
MRDYAHESHATAECRGHVKGHASSEAEKSADRRQRYRSPDRLSCNRPPAVRHENELSWIGVVISHDSSRRESLL